MNAADSPSSFAVSCPACGGWSSAVASMVGQAACCPHCAAPFLVPRHRAAGAPVASQVDRAEPPVRAVPVPPTAPPETSSQPPATAASAVAAEPEGQMPIHGPPAAAALETPGDRGQPPTFDIPDEVLAEPEPVLDMQFRVPVKTVGRGPNIVELRQLTPEERESRRRWRNVIMLLTGAAILMAIVVLFGGGRRR